eukprot:TRINITY_DN89888_c0_g1_i1.p1 TRINITY_DN89888_c0_g1~~TRINITY_DN89888_c0_g1_i1.p1  ORF type:complete len:109 (+),score=13.05 TRINITY_DN89888_c0_g1_i1:63-389(+)
MEWPGDSGSVTLHRGDGYHASTNLLGCGNDDLATNDSTHCGEASVKSLQMQSFAGSSVCYTHVQFVPILQLVAVWSCSSCSSNLTECSRSAAFCPYCGTSPSSSLVAH